MRKKMTKSARIRQLLKAGFTVKQVAAKVGCSAATVYTVRYMDKKKSGEATSTGIAAPATVVAVEPNMKPKRPRGRPRKVVDTVTQDPIGSWSIVAKYTPPPKLTWAQRFRALFVGRI